MVGSDAEEGDALAEAFDLALGAEPEEAPARALREDREHRHNRGSKHWRKRKFWNASPGVRSVRKIRGLLAPTEL